MPCLRPLRLPPARRRPTLLMVLVDFPLASFVLAGFALSGSALAAPLQAQQVVLGRVVEAGSDRPVVGAMVRLATDTGPTARRFLTGGDGRYRIVLPGPGIYLLDVERIGYATTRVGPFEASGGEAVVQDVEVASEAIALEGLGVEANRERRCSSPEDGASIQVLWDEARKALDAATWTEREGGLQFDLSTRVRELDSHARTVRDETREARKAFGSNSVRTLDPADLVEGGYVRQVDGFVYFYGPDASVLMSDPFLRTHCFTVRDGGDRGDRGDGDDEDDQGSAGLVGLAFEPVADRDTTDIEGVLWMDRTTGRLDRVEFTYTGLDRGTPGWSLARGRVDFLELGDGRWVVRDWHIQAPVLAMARGIGRNGRLQDRVVVGSVQELGSEVVRVRDGEGVAWDARRPTGAVAGSVWDSVSVGPLVGAEVRLAGRAWRTRTDAEGRWGLEGIPPGTYRLGFVHPRLDSLGVESEWSEVTVEAGTTREVALALPPMERLLALACGAEPEGVVVGFVRDAGGEPVPGVAVAVSDGLPEGTDPVDAITDAEGAFQLCGLPAGVDLRVEARFGPVRSRGGDVRTLDGRAQRVELRLESESGSVRSGAALEAVGRPAVQGRAVDGSTGQPVEGAEVVVTPVAPGSPSRTVVTDARGRFNVPVAESGPYRMDVRHLAYADVDGYPLDVPDGIRAVEVRLSSSAIALDEMVVEVEARTPRLDVSGFYDRRESGPGRFIDRTEVETMRLRETSDLIAHIPQLAVMPAASSETLDTTRRYIQFRSAARGWGDCLPAIYIDGAMARPSVKATSGLGGVATLDELVSPDQIEGIEVYSGVSQIPTQFAQLGTACGVIVVWTR